MTRPTPACRRRQSGHICATGCTCLQGNTRVNMYAFLYTVNIVFRYVSPRSCRNIGGRNIAGSGYYVREPTLALTSKDACLHERQSLLLDQDPALRI